MTTEQITLRAGDKQTMSSREIAELTGKNHADVMRDIRTMLEKLEIGQSKFAGTYVSDQNKILPCFNLDRYHTEVLVTGYDVKRRAAVIKRWYALESGESKPVGIRPASRLDALQTMLDTLREQEERMTSLEGQVDALSFEAIYRDSMNRQKTEYRIDQQRTAAIGKMATRLCKREGIETGSAPHPLYGQVNTYPAEILSLAFDLA